MDSVSFATLVYYYCGPCSNYCCPPELVMHNEHRTSKWTYREISIVVQCMPYDKCYGA